MSDEINSKLKFGCMIYKSPEWQWSLGFGISHDYNEIYVWCSLVKWYVAIGWFRCW